MHLLLTDIATCPRCGPSFGLILLADEMHDRRVREGWLGCANCREKYPVRDAVADLRHPPGASPADFPAGATGSTVGVDPERAYQVAALLGVTQGPATILVAGLELSLAEAIAAQLPHVELVAADPPGAVAGSLRMSVLRTGPQLPLRNRSLHGMVLASATADAAGAEWPREAARLLRAEARLVVLGRSDPLLAGIASAGLQLLLDEAGIVVASMPRGGYL
jgi:uncharacterized protein YbaR (Trm112 family)